MVFFNVEEIKTPTDIKETFDGENIKTYVVTGLTEKPIFLGNIHPEEKKCPLWFCYYDSKNTDWSEWEYFELDENITIKEQFRNIFEQIYIGNTILRGEFYYIEIRR